MTHGEDAGSETHQDTAVLTYLEGLLMHPVTNGPAATATRRSEANRGGGGAEEPRRNHVVGVAQILPLTNHAPAAREKTSPQGGASQHLKKARLLRSGPWGGETEGSRKETNATAAATLNEVQGGEHQARRQGQTQPQRSGQEGSPLGESTLLASLLTTLSSRLQTGASSQQLSQAPKLPPALNGFANATVSGGDKTTRSPDERLNMSDVFQGYGTASNRLKGLVRKSKMLNHETSGSPYGRNGNNSSIEKERASVSPCSNSSVSSAPHPSPSEAASPVSCAERLKAVANLVKTRSSPATTPSPRPSMACSQLALLLSSEAHLQQYSRQQALKAQLAGQSASERLAAMASQKAQDQRPGSTGEDRVTWSGSDMGATVNSQSRASPQSIVNVARGSRSVSPAPHSSVGSRVGSSSSSHSSSPLRSSPGQRERRPFEKPPQRPPQTCSSLLLLLLNNHNAQQKLTKNGHLQEYVEEDDEEEEEEEDEEDIETEGESIPSSRAPSLPPEKDRHPVERCPSPTKSSSDGGSIDLSCSPIDLSMRPRLSSLQPAPSSSSSTSSRLDKLTETMINKWRPDTPTGPQDPERRDLAASPGIRSHHRVTLLQLLLNQQNNEKANKIPDNPDLVLRNTAHGRGAPAENHERIGPSSEEIVRQSPMDFRISRARATRSRDGDVRATPSPYSLPSPQLQSGPLDLCKTKPFHGERDTVEPGFIASKLLQNLAQCGLSSISPSPPPPPPPAPLLLGQRPQKRPSPTSSSGRPTDKPSALLQRLVPPTQRASVPAFDSLAGGSFTPLRREPSPASPSAVSHIERLLERRTVLQLLLGSALHAEAPRTSGSMEEPRNARLDLTPKSSDSQDRSNDSWLACSNRPVLDPLLNRPNGLSQDHLNGPSAEHPNRPSFSRPDWSSIDSKNGPVFDIKIKTEPGEDSQDEGEELKWRHKGQDRRGSPLELHEEVKAEPCPTDIVSKYGLLSQLLKQQSSVYHPGPAKDPQRDSVEDQQDLHSAPSPKRRRMCLELAERLTSELCSRPMEPFNRVNGSLLLSPKREDSVGVRGLVNSRVPQRDHQGFNVLKQLLLADNCVKTPDSHSPSSGLLSPVNANGHFHQSPGNPKLSQLHWGSAALGHAPASSLGSPVPAHWQTSSNGFHGSPPRSKVSIAVGTPLTGSMKREATSPREPVRAKEESEAGSGREEQRGSAASPGSPQLSRDNPILYCMLQRGRAGQQMGLKDQSVGTSPQDVQVKKEVEVRGHHNSHISHNYREDHEQND